MILAKILLIDDDIELSEKTKAWLEKVDNFAVEYSTNAEDGWQLLSQFTYDLLILDWQMPGMSGIDLCRKVRANRISTPVLFLTGMSSLNDVEWGLESGADDYLKKPFALRELSARCRALLRRTAPLSEAEIPNSVAKLHVDRRIIEIGASTIKLTRLETGLIDFLIRNTGKTFSALEILKAVYPAEKESSEEAVRTLVRSLRVKLAQEPTLAEMIETVPGQGYRLRTLSNQATG